MLRVTLVPASPGGPRSPFQECSCCGRRYPVHRLVMRLLHGRTLDGDICPDCVLTGPAGAAAMIRARVTAHRKEREEGGGRGRASLVRRMERRALLLEGTPSFSLTARQAAVRETRERR